MISRSDLETWKLEESAQKHRKKGKNKPTILFFFSLSISVARVGCNKHVSRQLERTEMNQWHQTGNCWWLEGILHGPCLQDWIILINDNTTVCLHWVFGLMCMHLPAQMHFCASWENKNIIQHRHTVWANKEQEMGVHHNYLSQVNKLDIQTTE